MEDNREFKPIATKVTKHTAVMLDAICKKNGITTYELLQTIVDAIIRFMSEEQQLSQDFQRLMEIFFDDLRNSTFKLSDYTNNPGIIWAIMVLGDRNHSGNRSVLVEEPFFGNATEDWNVMHQLEAFINKTMPRLYRRLRRIGAELDCKNVYETISILAEQAIANDPDAEEIRQMFADNDRSDHGRKPADAPYVRHLNREPKP